MYRIFISYRRSDSESFSGRVRDRLRAEFGRRSVFMDTSTILGGAKFGEAIAQNLATCKVVVAVIGKTWLTTTNEGGQRRLDDPADWVRQELAQAIKSDAVVIPVTFGGAAMPKDNVLPPDLQLLAERNAVFINDADFDSDVAKLIEACEPHVPRPRRWPLFVGAAAILLALIAGAFHFIPSKQEFHGIRIVPDQSLFGRIPESPAAGTDRQRLYLVLTVGSKRVEIDDLTRKIIYVGKALSDLDDSKGQEDIQAARDEITHGFSTSAEVDLVPVLHRLNDPIVVSTLGVRPGDTVEAEIGAFEPDARKPMARCRFAIPTPINRVAPVYFLSRKSDDCQTVR